MAVLCRICRIYSLYSDDGDENNRDAGLRVVSERAVVGPLCNVWCTVYMYSVEV